MKTRLTTRLLKSAYIAFVYLFLYAPIFVLIAYSFNDSTYSLVWQQFTWKWYEMLLENAELHLVAYHSLILGVLSASFATLFGTMVAISLYRYPFRGKRLVYALLFILMVSPDIVTGISFLILFSTLKMPLGFWTLLLSHIAFCIPFVTVTVYSRLLGQDKNIFEAAKDLGATEGLIVRKILVPLLWPAIAAGWLLSFTLSLDDVLVSFFVNGPGFDILPLKIFSMVRVGVKPEINALCSVMFILTILIVIAYQLVTWKKEKCT
ncbi:MAG: spermidine putrescine transporter permease component potC [Pseudomonadota bacterium]|jgi:spermidine/putrescine transport system permease protein